MAGTFPARLLCLNFVGGMTIYREDRPSLGQVVVVAITIVVSLGAGFGSVATGDGQQPLFEADEGII